VWQIFRGSILIFTAILAVLYHRQRLLASHWTGVCVTIIDIIIVGLSAMSLRASAAHPSECRSPRWAS
jgi:hypothetical protein